ncbi:hypothetical protein [Ornithinimicrobium pekingense]|uniref:Uncharacterized protein n=1 Tax=Ornithinimicrobium pekingense TaxID=384677 RepID=A0ABQ2F7M5_9MICO|nr:hypothetical protein [Ornithinimicrobium pekingense]GGK69926.1 hypothetical protein GCM10011509_17940 [Ornithinimicrobium pekingense]
MSRSTDRWEDASPFAWIFGSALAFVALGAVTRAVLDRRDGGDRRDRGDRQATVRPPDTAEDDTLAGHPS